MGTRGAITFVSDGAERTVYNHFDSYPGGVGLDVLEFVRRMVSEDTLDLRREQVAKMSPVEGYPTKEELTELYVRQGGKPQIIQKGIPGTFDWYSALRDTQGNPDAILVAGFFEDAWDFPSDSLFCEWAYVIDLDLGVLEVHKGFQHAAHHEGRFANRPAKTNGYFPVRLVASWPFDGLPANAEMLGLE